MKNHDDARLLARKRAFDAKRRADAIERKRLANAAAARKVGGAK